MACRLSWAAEHKIEQFAVNFLLTMNSTQCFFTVAMRMLSKAPWTEAMVSLDVRQAAIVAISRGWYVKCEDFGKCPFTRAELALAAGAYQGLLTPTIPDDTTVALRTIIDHLPPACDSLFTHDEVSCPFCHATKNGIVPTFSISISWKSSEWVDLKTSLSQAQPFLGYLPKGWHPPGCDRDDQYPTVTRLGKWIYLELRPYPMSDSFFPLLGESITLLSDQSLGEDGLRVVSLVCSNLRAGANRHYWLIELVDGRIQHAYDSLQGLQPLTQEVYRALHVTGILLKADLGSKPCLRNQKLDQIGGKVAPVRRQQQPIKVPSRSNTCRTRRVLTKSMSKLSVTSSVSKPFFSGKCGESKNLTPILIGGKKKSTSRAPHASTDSRKGKAKPTGKAKFRAKAKAKPKTKAREGVHLKGIFKATAGGNISRTRKCDLSQLTGSHDSDGRIQHLSCPTGTVCPRKDNRPDGCHNPGHSGANNGKLGSVAAEDQPYENGVEHDPISNSTPWVPPSVLSPRSQKKRSLFCADLGDGPSCNEPSEDMLRRKSGPPKAAPSGIPCPDITPPIDGHLATAVPIARSDDQGTACCRASPGIAQGSCNIEPPTALSGAAPPVFETCLGEPGTARCRVPPESSVDGKVNTSCTAFGGRYGVIWLFDGVSSVVPILTKKFGYPPIAAVLAECDLAVRELVCAEFGYRSDEKWGYTGYTKDGTAVLYVSKWKICQDRFQSQT